MEELRQYVAVLIGLVVTIIAISVIGAGIAWLVNRPLLIVPVVGGVGWLAWDGAQRRRV